MAEERVQRRLTTILAADVVGYASLMERDEAGTLAALKSRRRDVLDPLVAKHQGRVFKVTGDGVLIEFGSAVSAVECAVELQKAMAGANTGIPQDRCIVLRIGVNLGDVVVEAGDLFGDGVNIAARLEAIADPGGILVSGTIFDHVRKKVHAAFDNLGTPTLKNITEPVHVYRVTGTPTVAATTFPLVSSKPSIAVLPFTNMSGDPEQQYFSDGISEDIITELSRFHSLFVIARNSSFLFRDKSVDIRQIGRDLGVEYVVEGSVRRLGSRLRITAQLIEAATGTHLWAERYDREIHEIFAVQDEVVQAIVAVLPARIEEAGARAAKRKRPENLAAYDYFLRGNELGLTFDDAQTPAAREMFEKAIALDGTISSAFAWLAMLRLREWWLSRSAHGLNEAFELARKAVATDENDGQSHGVLGLVYLERRRFDEATFHIERFFTLNPNDPTAAVFKGELLAYLGRAQEGIAWVEKAFRLNPLSPQAYSSFYGMILFAARRYAESIAAFNRVLVLAEGGWEFVYLVAGHAHLGRLEEACAIAGRCKALAPDFSLLEFASKEPYRDPADLEHLLSGLRKVTLPE